MPKLLVVDDEAAIQHAFQRAFRDSDIQLLTATTAGSAIEQFVTHQPDVVILDIRLPDTNGLETFRRLRQLEARVPVILVTGHGTTELAIEAMKEGAFDYLLKPLELQELRRLIDRALRSSQCMRVPASVPGLDPGPATGDVLIGRCPAMQEVYKAVGRVARQNVTVLITGESGTGKELIARAIYHHSDRANKPFLAINCGAIPESLIESELFGHEKGAFTGADRKRIGRFEQAHGGVLFLDEVGELTPLAQVKLLRVLQEQKFERVGGEETISANIRVIAATNADLETLVANGDFRKDLYFRLNVFTIRLPPLRERGDDLNYIVEHYLRRFSHDLARPVSGISAETLEVLRAYPWPGNIRELQSVLKQAILHAGGAVLLPEDLPSHVRTGTPQESPRATAPTNHFDWDAFVAERIAAGSNNVYAEGLERMERELLVRILKHTGGNQLQAAKLLGITRGSLRTKIRTLGISISREIWSNDAHADF